MVAYQYSWFWNERFWLPPNVTWADLRNTDEVQYPQTTQLYVSVGYAVVLLIIRLIFERFIAGPIGQSLGIPGERKYAEPNAILEKVFTSITKNPDEKRLQGLAKQLDWSERQVQRWFRRRRNQDRPTLLQKFKEGSWRFTFYTLSFSYAVTILKDKPWLKDIKYCWYDFPDHPLTDDITYLYIVELGFYWSLIFSLFRDVKRKDFWQMVVHHVATIMLVSFSWVANFVRIGSLILACHDMADIFLEAAKLLNYAKCQGLCDACFVVFAIVFFVSRLFIYPYWLVYSAATDSTVIAGTGMFPAYYVFNGLLLLLQCLHIFWGITIAKMAYKFVISGTAEKDDRSDVEENSDVDENGKINGLYQNGPTSNSTNHVH
ncbi:ceramide synthase 6-like isoform X1 [Branchiostoma floridae x Branchiostoma japonicum]